MSIKKAKKKTSKRKSVKDKVSIIQKAWQKAVTHLQGQEEVSYDQRIEFNEGDKIVHQKFGQGVVRVALQDKIEVLFRDYIKILVHNRDSSGYETSVTN